MPQPPRSPDRGAQLVLAPGMLCDAEVWRDQSASLSDAVACLTPDYGQARTFEDMALAVLVQAAPRFSIAGHSMGGRVALEVCRLAPERVERLCLLATEHRPAPPGGPGSDEAKGREALLRKARSEGMAAVAKAWLPHLIHPDRLHDALLADRVLAMIARQSPEAMEAQIEAGAARPDSTKVLKHLRVPLLIMGGEDDGVRPPQSQRDMAALVPAARLRILERCGHMITLERPREVVDEMRRWLGATAV